MNGKDASSRAFSILVLVSLLSLSPGGCRSGAKMSTEGVPSIRVRLAAGADQVLLLGKRPAVFRTESDGKAQTLALPGDTPVAVALEGDRWRIGSVSLAGGPLAIEPASDGDVLVNGQIYRGSYRLVPSAGGKFDVINHLDVESYLLSVLPRELYRDWDIEAYKAQCIVARTYALYELRTDGAKRHWDVWPDTRSQVYGGMAAETSKATDAVQATRGVVVAWGSPGQERIFKAYFSACCGGAGQNVADGFNETFIPPLSEQNVGNLCNISPKFTWPPVTISNSELTRRIRSWGASRGHPIASLAMLQRIDIEYVNRFQRPVRFILTDQSGQRYTLGPEETRWACNADAGSGPKLLSSFFKPINQPGQVVFAEGRGFGHGVGMCQWCAQARALRGIVGEDIVRLSYPQSVLIRAY